MGMSFDPTGLRTRPIYKTSPRPIGTSLVYEVSLPHLAATLRHSMIHLNVMIVRRELVFQFGGFLKHAWAYEDWNFAAHVADLTSKTLYRHDIVANYRFPQGDSVSLTYSDLFVHLQELMSAQEVRLNCDRRLIRRCARTVESWIYRKLSRLSIEKHHGKNSIFTCLAGILDLSHPWCSSLPRNGDCGRYSRS